MVSLADIVVTALAHVDVQGFTWINEGKRPDSPKWGYVSTSVGNNLKIMACPAMMVLAYGFDID